jgi:hypothetical protein
MRYRLLTAALLVATLAIAAAVPAEARMHAGPNMLSAGHRLRAYLPPPLDGITTPAAAAYGFRRLRSAYAGPAIRIIRDSDQAQADIGFTATGDFNTTTAAAHCAAANCYLMTAYDQTGNGRHATQAAAGSRPYLQFNCIGGRPCASSTWTGIGLNSASVSWAAGPVSLSVVGRRTTGTGYCGLIARSLNQIAISAVNDWLLTAYQGGQIDMTAADGAPHAAAAVFDVANAAVMRVDGTEVAGVVAQDPAAGTALFIGGDASTTCDGVEGFIWANYALTADERLALTANQLAYYRIPPPLVLDTLPASAAAYSFRKLRNAYVGPAVKLRRTSGGTQDIGFTGNDFDTAAAMTFCAATTCFVDTRYDQSGNSRHASQTNPAAQPQLVFNCIGTLPCASSTAGQFMQAPDVTPGATSASFSVVLRAAAPGGLCYGIQAASQLLGINGGSLVLYNGASIAQAVSAAVWHSGVGVIAGAGSVVGVDGVETTGSITAVTTPGPIYELYNGAAPVCSYTEAVWWDNVALTAPQRTVLQTNQKSFWGTP